MELTNEFRVSVPVDRAWAVLTDVETIAPCMPGAELQEIEGDEYRGVVKIKVGPITAQYKGKATFVSQDQQKHVAVLRAEGRDTRGQGNASATITATLEPAGDATDVKVVTDLTVTGKVAQFGRGVLADVSAKLLKQFVECLETDLLTADAEPGTSGGAPNGKAARETAGGSNGSTSGDGAASATRTTTTARAEGAAATAADPRAAGPRKVEHREAQPVDLLDAAGVPMAKRAIPVVAGVLVILWFLRRRRRRRG